MWPPSSPDQMLQESIQTKFQKSSASNDRISLLSNDNVVTLKSEDTEDPPMGVDCNKRMSLCSQEVSTFSDKKLQNKKFGSSICESFNGSIRPSSPVPDKQLALSVIQEVTSASEMKGFHGEKSTLRAQHSHHKTCQVGGEERMRKAAVEESFSKVSKSAVTQIAASSMKIVSIRSRSTTPELLDISSKPHEIKSLLPPASAVRPLTPTQVVVFPPELPAELPKPKSRPVTPQSSASPNTFHKSQAVKHTKKESEKKLKGETQKQRTEKEKVFTKLEVEQIVREEVEKMLKVKEKEAIKTSSLTETSKEMKKVTIKDLPKPLTPSGPMASALSTATDRPFSPIKLPKPIELSKPKPVQKGPVSLPPETEPYFPPPPPPPESENLDERTARALREVHCRSPMTEALTVAPDRPYSPLPAATCAISLTTSSTIDKTTTFQPINGTLPSRGKKQMSMLTALTVAPEVPFTVPGKTPIPSNNTEVEERVSGAFKPLPSSSATSVIPKPTPLSDNGGIMPVSKLKPKYFPAVTYVPQPKMETTTFVNRQKEPEIEHESVPIGPTKSVQSITKTKISMSECTKKSATGLQSPDLLPHYQQNVEEMKRFSPKPHPVEAPKVPSVQYSTLYKSKVQSTKALFDKSQEISNISKVSLHDKVEKKSEMKMGPPTKSKIMEETKKTVPHSKSPSLLPYYQENIGEIPVRNRSISPVPHLIRAPMINPTPLYPPEKPKSQPKQKIFASSLKSNASTMSSMRPNTSSTKCTTSFGHTGSQVDKATMNINKSIQVYKPEVSFKQSSMKELHKSMIRQTLTTERPVSPWKAEVRTVQNLSPIEVRLPSPLPSSKPFKVSSNLSSTSTVVKPSPSSCPLPLGGSSSGGATGGGRGTSAVAGSTAPRRGRGVLNTSIPPGGRIPVCGHCNNQIRGPFITALGKIWCPEHFLCVNAKCRRPLQDIGFVEESEGLYCEYCFEQYLAPTCTKCNSKIKGDCLNAIGKQFHPECFSCSYCGKLFGNNPFFLEDALPYCETDWNELFTTKCFSCGFPIEAGDRWVEALDNNYHSQCFNCTMCKKNLEGQSFYAKAGRPFCKNHAR